MAKFKLKKVSTDENGNNIYKYRGFIIRKEYLWAEGYNWFAGDEDDGYYNVVHIKPDTPVVMGNCDWGSDTYAPTIKELKEYLDEYLDDENVYICTSPWPFDFSEQDPYKRKMQMDLIIDKSKFINSHKKI